MEWTAVSCVVFAIFLSIKAEPVVSSAQEDKSLSPDPAALYNSAEPDNQPLRDFAEQNTLVKERVNEMYSDLEERFKNGDSHLKKLIEEGLEHVKEQRKDGDERLKEELDEDVEWLKARQDKRRRQTEDELAEGEEGLIELKEAFGKLEDNVKQWTQLNQVMTEDMRQQMSDFQAELNGTSQQMSDFQSELNGNKQQMSDFQSELNGNKQQMSDFQTELNGTSQQMSDFQSELNGNKQQMSDFKSELNGNKQQMSDFQSKLNSINQQMSDFQTDLNNTMKKLLSAEQAIISLNARVAPKQTPSFRSVLADPDKVTANTPIPFRLDFAVGEGDYNQTTGVYTVTVPGVYSFVFHLYPKRATRSHIALYVNSSVSILSRCHSSEYSTHCTASTLLRVQKGDRVWVQTGYGGAYWSVYHSYFFGALVSPDP
ncbi:uncharacterized protein LOC143289888 [Babylonia areolata]|uniref:uncharacterized protein LOC143289888 n=1 Tax=Babylonia areolata TaxID=304850 RepID=UPI003FCFE469